MDACKYNVCGAVDRLLHYPALMPISEKPGSCITLAWYTI